MYILSLDSSLIINCQFVSRYHIEHDNDGYHLCAHTHENDFVLKTYKDPESAQLGLEEVAQWIEDRQTYIFKI